MIPQNILSASIPLDNSVLVYPGSLSFTKPGN